MVRPKLVEEGDPLGSESPRSSLTLAAKTLLQNSPSPNRPVTSTLTPAMVKKKQQNAYYSREIEEKKESAPIRKQEDEEPLPFANLSAHSEASPVETISDENNPQSESNDKQSKESAFEVEGRAGDRSSAVPSVVSQTSSLLAMARNRKAAANKLSSWVALLLTLDGRDKVTKVAQYVARFLAWNLNSRRFAETKQHLTQARKAFRLGRSWIELHRLGLLLETFRQQPMLRHMASSNVGFGPNDRTEEAERSYILRFTQRTLRSLNSMAVKAPSNDPLWKVMGTAVRLVGLLGFWTADNLSFLTSSGLFDHYRLTDKERLDWRKHLASKASIFANRSYFVAALAGLVVSWKSYREHHRSVVNLLMSDEEKDGSLEGSEAKSSRESSRELEQARHRQLTLLLALLKSCCDVIVFSNNPGIDLWFKASGRKLHEGVHCALGLTSASTVLYNNFPNAAS